MKIGILQTGHAPAGLVEEFGEYPSMFTRLLDGHGFDFQVWRVVDGEFPPSVEAADGWLVTGSRHGAYEDLPWIPPLQDFLRKAVAAGKPVVGICFGHQILARALGGQVEKFAGGWSVGPTDYTLAEGGTVTLNAWHQDQVTRRPAGARVLASSDFCENAILAYGPPGAEYALTIQAHPEFSNSFIRGLIDARGKGVVPEPVLQDARQRLDRPLSTDWAARQIAEFFLDHAPESAAQQPAAGAPEQLRTRHA